MARLRSAGDRAPRAAQSARRAGAVASFIALTACTAGGSAPIEPSSPPATGTPAPFLDGCRSARPITTRFPNPRDLVIGPLSYAGLRDFGSPPQTPNWHGRYYYKSGAQLRPGTTATVAIAAAAVGYARVMTERGPQTGALAVTYRACAGQAAGYWWVGGFGLVGRRTGCVPIEVTAPGAAAPWHAVVPLGVAHCD